MRGLPKALHVSHVYIADRVSETRACAVSICVVSRACGDCEIGRASSAVREDPGKRTDVIR